MKRNSPLRRILALLCTVMTAGCSVFGIRSGTEQPRYDVVAQVGPVEIRHYAARVAATTTIAADQERARYEGFQILARYIFGHNKTGASVAMTAPVAQSAAGGSSIPMTAPVAAQANAGGGWTIAFYAPASFTPETMPTPNDSRVKIVTIPPADYAVLRFTGDRSADAIALHTRQLTAALAGSPWRGAGPALAWFYDPPWTLPFLRRNEVAVPLSDDARE